MFCEFPEFRRCCFCLPLRSGVLIFGYLNAIFSAFMVGIYSYGIHVGHTSSELLFHGTLTDTSGEICITSYLLEIIVNIVLLYGAHARHLLCLKIFYYYSISTMVACLLLQVLNIAFSPFSRFVDVELFALVFAGLSLQLYVVILVRTLIKKLSIDGPNIFENQLQQIVSGERKFEPNEVYQPITTIPNDLGNV